VSKLRRRSFGNHARDGHAPVLILPNIRVRAANQAPILPDRKYVLYWMIAARRSSWNFALDRAIGYARTLSKPLIVFEPLECDYPWASDRLHRFVTDGMADNAAAFAKSPITYFPYVEAQPGDGGGLLEALAARACVVLTDDFPCSFLPRLVASAAVRLDVRLEAVDSNGLLPLAATDRAFITAASFRRFVQKTLPEQLNVIPEAAPLARLRLETLTSIPRTITSRWPAASRRLLDGDAAAFARLPIDHGVPAVSMRGGSTSGRQALEHFVDRRLSGYAELQSEPESNQTSRLSPYLHFGHVSAHQVFDSVMGREGWSRRRVAGRPAVGAREGWWGVSASAERFLDQFVVWRELGYNMCARRPDDYDRYASLPEWARATLETHKRDRRPYRYDLETLECGATHDRLWNAAQGQLRREGWMHNYLRMLWGKKILEWSTTPQQALDRMIAIMNRWSIDGRDPNSYSGYFWTLGRYDRPWPERDIFGVVRYMSSANTARKFSVKNYIEEFAPESSP
jgi:deoxyribodipyrimidine photo-lyase